MKKKLEIRIIFEGVDMSVRIDNKADFGLIEDTLRIAKKRIPPFNRPAKRTRRDNE
tara:strand:- start:616 stop:783 length:168 start_codon:yes stop_codon:yes gene_type:complete